MQHLQNYETALRHDHKGEARLLARPFVGKRRGLAVLRSMKLSLGLFRGLIGL
jgi:hypothetical protein